MPAATAAGAQDAGGRADATLLLPQALRVVAVAGLLAVVPVSLLPGALVAGASSGLALLLMPVLTLGAVFAYRRSQPSAVLTPTGGSRLGALLGFWMGSLLAAITGVFGFILRYRYHSLAMDEKIEQAAAQVPAQLRAAGQTPADVLQLLATPEFRAGSFIFGHVLSLLLLVLAGAVCGWMAATVLRVRQQRSL